MNRFSTRHRTAARRVPTPFSQQMSELQQAFDQLAQRFAAVVEAQAAAEQQPVAARPAVPQRPTSEKSFGSLPPPADPSAHLRDPLRMLRAKQVAELLGIHTITVWKWTKDKRFPPPVAISPTAKAWRASDVAAWIEERAKDESA